jgi:hypothetical protein
MRKHMCIHYEHAAHKCQVELQASAEHQGIPAMLSDTCSLLHVSIISNIHKLNVQLLGSYQLAFVAAAALDAPGFADKL